MKNTPVFIGIFLKSAIRITAKNSVIASTYSPVYAFIRIMGIMRVLVY